MKKFIKIVSILCISMLLLSMSVFAYENNAELNFLLKADKESYSAGDTVTVTIYAENNTETVKMQSVNAYLLYNKDNFTEVVSYDDNAMWDSGENFADSNFPEYNAQMVHTFSAGRPNQRLDYSLSALAVATFTIDSNLADGNYTFYLYDIAIMDGDGNVNLNKDALIHDELTITVGEAGPIVEYFEDFAADKATLDGTAKMKDIDPEDKDKRVEVDIPADAKVAAIFAKNVSTTDTLAPGSYGITFGGVKYAGQSEVKPGETWAIKLVDPEGKYFKTGNKYTYTYFLPGQDPVTDKDGVAIEKEFTIQ